MAETAISPGFDASSGTLTCDGVSLASVAGAVGTPVHVYSAPLIAARYRAFEAAIGGYPHRLHYALKANATLAVVRSLRALGARADANSGGEIEVALRAGFAPADLVFTGVGKTPAELERAVTLGVGAINAESPGEVDRLDAIARAQGVVARLALRVNPGVEAHTHPHIATGRQADKFGMPAADVRRLAAEIARRPSLRLVGLHVHVGSQINRRDVFQETVDLAAGLAREIAAAVPTLEHLDLGGGLGIAYRPDDVVLSIEDYCAVVIPAVRSTGLTAVFEPGRWLVGPAGVLLTRVVDVKHREGARPCVVVDAGMTDLVRPALYGAWHGIEPVTPRPGALSASDVVGPVCESADTLGLDRHLPPLEAGDLLAVRDTGAYGAVMASNYNRRPAAAEVIVAGGEWRVARRRQTVDDLLQWDT